MRRYCLTLLLLLALIASPARAFTFVHSFTGSYAYTNHESRISLNQVAVSTTASVSNTVVLKVITAAGITSSIYDVSSSTFVLTLWPPTGVSTSVYLYAGDVLLTEQTATNLSIFTLQYSGLDATRIHGTSNIIANTIGAVSMDTNSVPAYAIQAGAVTAAKLATNSVSGTANIIDGSVDSNDLAAATIVLSKMATNSVSGTANIIDGSVNSNDLANGSVGTTQLSTNGMGSGGCTNCTVVFGPDGRATSVTSGTVPSNLVNSISEVLSNSPNAKLTSLTNATLVQATTVAAGTVNATSVNGSGAGITSISGTNVGANTVGAAQIVNTALNLDQSDGGSAGYTQEGPYTTTSSAYGPWASIAVFSGFVNGTSGSQWNTDIEYADDSGFATNMVVIARINVPTAAANGFTVPFAVKIPKGKYARVHLVAGAVSYYIRYGVLEF